MDVKPFWCDDNEEQEIEDALRAACKRYGVAYIEPGGQHYNNELDHRAIKAALAKKARSTRRRALRAALTRAPPPLCVCCSLRLNEAGENLRQLVRQMRHTQHSPSTRRPACAPRPGGGGRSGQRVQHGRRDVHEGGGRAGGSLRPLRDVGQVRPRHAQDVPRPLRPEQPRP